jgi:hypothetical protein
MIKSALIGASVVGAVTINIKTDLSAGGCALCHDTLGGADPGLKSLAQVSSTID